MHFTSSSIFLIFQVSMLSFSPTALRKSGHSELAERTPEASGAPVLKEDHKATVGIK